MTAAKNMESVETLWRNASSQKQRHCASMFRIAELRLFFGNIKSIFQVLLSGEENVVRNYENVLKLLTPHDTFLETIGLSTSVLEVRSIYSQHMQLVSFMQNEIMSGLEKAFIKFQESSKAIDFDHRKKFAFVNASRKTMRESYLEIIKPAGIGIRVPPDEWLISCKKYACIKEAADNEVNFENELSMLESRVLECEKTLLNEVQRIGVLYVEKKRSCFSECADISSSLSNQLKSYNISTPYEKFFQKWVPNCTQSDISFPDYCPSSEVALHTKVQKLRKIFFFKFWRSKEVVISSNGYLHVFCHSPLNSCNLNDFQPDLSICLSHCATQIDSNSEDKKLFILRIFGTPVESKSLKTTEIILKASSMSDYEALEKTIIRFIGIKAHVEEEVENEISKAE